MSKTERKNQNDNVLTAEKYTTVNGYKMQGTHVILTPSQFLAFEATFKSLLLNFEAVGVKLPNELNLKSHIITSLKDITKCNVVDYQVGADRSTNLTDKMRDVQKQIADIVSKSSDAVIHGKHMFIGADNVPRELSCTFTLRTPPDTDRAEYVKQIQKQIAELKSNTEEVINK